MNFIPGAGGSIYSMWDKIMDTNVKGVYNVSKYCIPEMHKKYPVIEMSYCRRKIICHEGEIALAECYAIIFASI